MNAFYKNTFTASLAIIAFLLVSPAFGFPWDKKPTKDGIPWGNNIIKAQEMAKQSNKLILLHFYADACPPCRMMESSTFPNPMISQTIQNSFIPVKLNRDRCPAEAKMFKVQGVPMDIVLSPNGHWIQATVGGHDVNSYAQFLSTAQLAGQPFLKKAPVANQQPGTATISGSSVAAGNNLGNKEHIADNGVSPSANSTPPLPDFPAPPVLEFQSSGEYPGVPLSKVESGGACPIDETPSFDYASIPEEDRVRIEFEGYCPVELTQHSMWVRGDYNNRLQFEGRLYLFAGKAQRDEFNRNPEKYAPAFQGIDIVVWRERGEKVHGVRNYGAWAVGRVFLFSSEENLIKFEKNARYYLTPNKN